jgi:hypothetical protein
MRNKLLLTGIAALFLATGTAHADTFILLIQENIETPSTTFVTNDWTCAEALERHEANRKAGTWLMYQLPEGGTSKRIIWIGCLSAVSYMHCPTIAKKNPETGKTYCQDMGFPQPKAKK